MARTQVELEIITLLKDAQRDVQKFSKETQKELESISFASTVTAISTGFLAIKAVATPVLGAIKDGFAKAIDEALEAEKAITDLSNALRIQNDFSSAAIDNFERFASEIQATTTFSDDAVISALALAKSFKATNDEAEKVVRTAADLAAVTGTDLNTATFQVAQTLNGFVDKGLAKSIPGLKALSKEALIAGDGIRVIAREVEGSAGILANTFGGAVQQAKNSFSEIFEEFGKAIIQTPELIGAIKQLGAQFGVVAVAVAKVAPEIASFVSGSITAITGLVAGLALIAKGLANIFSVVIAAPLQFLLDIIVKFGKAIYQIVGAIYTLGKTAGDAQKAFINFGKALNPLNLIKRAQDNLAQNDDFFDPIIFGAVEVKKAADDAAKSVQNLDAIFKKQGESRSGAGARKQNATDPDAEAKKAAEAAKKFRAEIEAIAKDPSKFVVDVSFGDSAKKSLGGLLTASQKTGIAAATGFISSISKGAEGAKGLVSGIVGNIADLIVPGLGGPISEIVGFLAQGPDKVRETVRSFAAAIPEVIKAIVTSIPVLIQEISNAIPQIVDGLINALPEIVRALAAAMPQVAISLSLQMPKVAITFATSLIKNIPEIIKGFAQEFLKIPGQFVDALLDFLNPFGGGGGGGGFLGDIPVIGDIIGGIGDVFGFASGGRVPDRPEFRGDRFPARLDAGEQVLSRDLTNELQNFLDNGGGPTQVVLQVGEQQLANVLLNLNKRRFRTGFQRA